eukprot:1161222-Pelagomonas_calceolata.AAC.9
MPTKSISIQHVSGYTGRTVHSTVSVQGHAPPIAMPSLNASPQWGPQAWWLLSHALQWPRSPYSHAFPQCLTSMGSTSADSAKALILAGMVALNISVCRCPCKVQRTREGGTYPWQAWWHWTTVSAAAPAKYRGQGKWGLIHGRHGGTGHQCLPLPLQSAEDKGRGDLSMAGMAVLDIKALQPGTYPTKFRRPRNAPRREERDRRASSWASAQENRTVSASQIYFS